jgi:hypothetical protein
MTLLEAAEMAVHEIKNMRYHISAQIPEIDVIQLDMHIEMIQRAILEHVR